MSLRRAWVRGRSWDPRWIVGLRRLLRAEHFDVVHSHSPITTIGARIALRTIPRRTGRAGHDRAQRLGQPRPRDPPGRCRDRPRRRDPPRGVRSRASRSMPARLRSSTRVIQYGIDVAAVRAAAPGRDGVRRSLGVAPHEVLDRHRRQPPRDEGLPRPPGRGRAGDRAHDGVRFVALGQGPMGQELLDQADRLGLGDCFRFLGYRSDASRSWRPSTSSASPSLHEGLPVTLMEALVLGIPVVATDVGGTGEIVTDGREAVLVPPGAPDQLAAALHRVVGDPSRRRRWRHAARTRGDVARRRAGAIRDVEAVYRELVAVTADTSIVSRRGHRRRSARRAGAPRGLARLGPRRPGSPTSSSGSTSTTRSAGPRRGSRSTGTASSASARSCAGSSTTATAHSARRCAPSTPRPHPDYQGRGIFRALTLAAVDRAERPKASTSCSTRRTTRAGRAT